jgi:hypothetical protein
MSRISMKNRSLIGSSNIFPSITLLLSSFMWKLPEDSQTQIISEYKVGRRTTFAEA